MKETAAELKVGDAAPEFHATAVGGEYGAGKEISLTNFRASPVVLYFYPKMIRRDAPFRRADCAMRGAN